VPLTIASIVDLSSQSQRESMSFGGKGLMPELPYILCRLK
jgi:hypothetical protein